MVLNTVSKELFGKPINAVVQIFDNGIQITITGGDCSHIGAVSIVDFTGNLTTTTFSGHKEDVISSNWALKFYQHFQCPVVVTAGIHYNHISFSEIQQVVALTDQILDSILDSHIS